MARSNKRQVATQLRAREYGRANQISYEAAEGLERSKTKAALAANKKQSLASGLQRGTAAERGMNKGTAGFRRR